MLLENKHTDSVFTCSFWSIHEGVHLRPLANAVLIVAFSTMEVPDQYYDL